MQQYLHAMASMVESRNDDRCRIESNDIGSERTGRKKWISSRKLRAVMLSLVEGLDQMPTTNKENRALASSSAKTRLSIGSPLPLLGVFLPSLPPPGSSDLPSMVASSASSDPSLDNSEFLKVSGLYVRGRNGASWVEGSVKAAIRLDIATFGNGRACAGGYRS